MFLYVGALWDDESTSEYEGNYARFNDLKVLNPKLKTLLSIGGAKAGNSLVPDKHNAWCQRSKIFLRLLLFQLIGAFTADVTQYC